jgi:hypothetical protein
MASEPAFEWDKGREGTARGSNLSVSSFFSLIPCVKGDSHPGLCAQRTDEGG